MNHPLFRFRYIFFFLLSILFLFIFQDSLKNAAVKIKTITKEYETQKDLEVIKNSLVEYKARNGLYPPDHRFTMWYKNNISNKLYFTFPLDRWGEPLIYKTFKNRQLFEVISKGKDLINDTKDDIVVKSPDK